MVDTDYVSMIEDSWKYQPEDLQKLGDFHKINRKFEGSVLNQDTYLEFIEKLVILDILDESYVNEYFIRNKAFPFSEQGFMGNETAVLNTVTFWKHYRQKHAKDLVQIATVADDYLNYKRELGIDLSVKDENEED